MTVSVSSMALACFEIIEPRIFMQEIGDRYIGMMEVKVVDGILFSLSLIEPSLWMTFNPSRRVACSYSSFNGEC